MGVLRARVNGVWVDILQAQAPGTAAGGIDIADEGLPVAVDASALNFTGLGVTVSIGAAGEVIVNIPGGVAPPAPLEFSFAVPLTEWIIDHNLNSYHVEVNCFDTNGVEYDPEISYPTVNQAIVRWYYPTAGVARIIQ